MDTIIEILSVLLVAIIVAVLWVAINVSKGKSAFLGKEGETPFKDYLSVGKERDF